MNQGPAYFTRSSSSPVRRPRSYSRSPAKLLKEGGLIQNHPLGHLLGVLVLDHVPDQGLLLTPEVGLDLYPTADLPQGMKHGKENCTSPRISEKLFKKCGVLP